MVFWGGDRAGLTRSLTACRYEEMWADGKDFLPEISAWLEKRVVDPTATWAADSGYDLMVNSTCDRESGCKGVPVSSGCRIPDAASKVTAGTQIPICSAYAPQADPIRFFLQ